MLRFFTFFIITLLFNQLAVADKSMVFSNSFLFTVAEEDFSKNGFSRVQSDTGSKISYNCIGNVLYISIDKNMVSTYNPLTKEPYFCVVWSEKEVDAEASPLNYYLEVIFRFEDVISKLNYIE